MLIVWGSRLYGRTDEVAGMFHVATDFGHLYYVPLFPTQSYVVTSVDSTGFRGVKVPMSMKSVMIAWLRAVLIAFAVMAVLAAIVITSLEWGRGFTWALVGRLLPAYAILAVGIGAAVWSYRSKLCRYASYERAMELAGVARVSQVDMLRIGVIYGKITPAEAARMEMVMGGSGNG